MKPRKHRKEPQTTWGSHSLDRRPSTISTLSLRVFEESHALVRYVRAIVVGISVELTCIVPLQAVLCISGTSDLRPWTRLQGVDSTCADNDFVRSHQKHDAGTAQRRERSSSERHRCRRWR